jgi:ATP-binding cassette subfamily C (CFTR/MRP) protein 1
VYLTWVKAAGGLLTVGGVIFIFSLAEACKLFSNWWLTYWSAHGNENVESPMWFLGIYALINVAAIILNMLESVTLMLIALRAFRQLFSRVLDSTMRAPMLFFDTTPLGRIINRFSKGTSFVIASDFTLALRSHPSPLKDVYTVDESLPDTLDTYLFCLLGVISTLVVISAVTPMFTLCLLPILYLYQVEQKYFTVSYRELKRLDSVQRSPVYALFGETLDGASTIRAFKAENSLLNRMVTMLDNQQHAYFLTVTAQSWLGVRLELLGTSIVTAACLAAVFEHDVMGGNETFAGLAGLSDLLTLFPLLRI